VTQSFKVTAVTVTGASLSLAPGNGGAVTVAISGLSAAPTTLGLSGTPLVNVPTGQYNLGGSNGTLGVEFINVTSTSATLVVYVPATVQASTTAYSIPITIGSAAVGTLSLTVPFTPQTITFAAIPTQTVKTSLTLTATASSKLAVSYSSSTMSVCTVSGTTATFAAAGTCTITASQPGNNVYSAASTVTQSFTVSLGITASASATIVHGNGATPTVTISGATSAQNLGLGANNPCVNLAGCTYSLGSAGGIGFEFLNDTASSATLVVYVTSATQAGSYAIPITIGSSQIGTFSLTVK
jgi:hypothetical protein